MPSKVSATKNLEGARSTLKAVRSQKGLAAADLAKLAGVSRQTIYAIEDGRFLPNTLISLKLAKALKVSVDDLFSLTDENRPAKIVDAEAPAGRRDMITEGQLVRLFSSANASIAVPVQDTFDYLPTADGFVDSKLGRGLRVKLPFESNFDQRKQEQFLVVAGCDPALSLLRRAASPFGVEVIPLPLASQRALTLLANGVVHVAGSLLLDTKTDVFNLTAVRSTFPNGGVKVLNFAVWQTGFVTAPGNPKNLHAIADLARADVSIINREAGSGPRAFLDAALKSCGLTGTKVNGYRKIAHGHLRAAFYVANGWADCCLATSSAARCFGLGFVPLKTERFDLVFPEAFLKSKLGQTVANILNQRTLRHELAGIAGYETGQTGKALI